MKIGGECGREVVTPLVTSVNLWKDRTKRTRTLELKKGTI